MGPNTSADDGREKFGLVVLKTLCVTLDQV
jgi:hypothetical protein